MSLVTLIAATLVGCSWLITNPLKHLLEWLLCRGEGAEEKRLLQEVSSLRRSLQNISMADQFAAWAKLQRQINAQTQAYQLKASNRHGSEQRMRNVCSLLVNAAVSIAGLCYIWSSRGSAVTELPSHLLHPFTALLALPGCHYGEISVMTWIMCVRTVSSRVSAALPAKVSSSSSNTGGNSLMSLWPLLSQIIPH